MGNSMRQKTHQGSQSQKILRKLYTMAATFHKHKACNLPDSFQIRSFRNNRRQFSSENKKNHNITNLNKTEFENLSHILQICIGIQSFDTNLDSLHLKGNLSHFLEQVRDEQASNILGGIFIICVTHARGKR